MAGSAMVRGSNRIRVGVWAEWPEDARWANEGMTRLIGFLIEGIAVAGEYQFCIVLPDWIRDEAEADLASLAAIRGRDYSVHSPRDSGVRTGGQTMLDVLAFANKEMEVAGWLSIFPNFSLAAQLNGPLAVIFPDAIPKVFPQFSDVAWGEDGLHRLWEERVRETLAHADTVVAFSEHVRDQQLGPLFGVAPERVKVVPHAMPDLLPNLAGSRSRTGGPASRFEAASLLRDYAMEQGWEYLIDYPFEEAPYVAVSTQDRVTKNVRLIVDAVLRLVRNDHVDLRILSTAPLHFGANWTPLPKTIEDRLAHRDYISVPDLPRAEHAAFYHCAALAVHASVFEGGHAPFPFSEAVSVGTPCLMADGPHLRELCRDEPRLSAYLFDPNDADGLASAIWRAMAQRDRIVAEQLQIYERLRMRTWGDVALAYASAAASGDNNHAEP